MEILSYANTMTAEIKFEHIKDDVFCYGSKQVTLMDKKSGLYARTGGGFIPLDEFVRLNQNIQSRKISR